MAYRRILSRLAPFASVLAFIVAACTLVGNEKNDQKFSFNKSFDTLAQFDSVVITLKDTTGKTIDILYRGKADTVEEIENRAAPHWDGSGIVIVSVVGYDSGLVVYHVNKKYNGSNSQVLDTLRVILPGTILSAATLDLTLTEGDSVPLPTVTVSPPALSDKSLSYASSAPSLLFVGNGYLRALQRGAAKLNVSLNSNPSKAVTISVIILPNPLTPDAIQVVPDTLRLAAGGAPGILSASALPATADASVTWSVKDTAIAAFTAPGVLQGLKAGQTWALATSLRKPSLSDSSLILVQAPVAVASVRFLKDTLDLFVGGAAESLTVVVLPALANPKVEFTVLAPNLVSLTGGRVRGLSEGKTRVVAKSVENPALSDTLDIVVLPTQTIESVKIASDSITLYTGGATASLTGKVYPLTANQSLLWRVQNEAFATITPAGTVTPKAPGRTSAVATSRVDSTKKDTALIIVKRDAPVLSVGRDTVLAVGSTLIVRPTATQDYGAIVQFTWDANGDGTFEGLSDTLKAVSIPFPDAREITLSFSVKDTEGNQTVATKKVKAVAGPVVQILAPLDSTYTRLFTIDVSWTVNGKEQDSLKKEVLKLGANTITRSAKDEAGNVYPAVVTVIVDTTGPNKPVVKGILTSASKTPTWTWGTGGGGGSGAFKYWLDVDDSSKGKQTTDTAFTPATELSEGVHTLFVAERDRAGNWSLPGRFSTRIDVSAPGVPKVATTPASPTNVRKPKWTWSSGGNGSGAFRYKLDNNTLTTGATATSDTAFTPAANLSHGVHTLYVQEKDSAGNWSESGFAAIAIDTIAPGAPSVTAAQSSPTHEARPTWNWTGAGGGRGYYRYKVGDTVWASGGLQGSVTQYRPEAALAEGARTLYVAEQDSAGNWGPAGSLGLTLDLTAPGAPKMDSTPYSPLNTLRPTWTWKTGGGGNGTYRVRVDNPDLAGGTMVASASFSQPTDLSEGKHTLYVQERDAAGNWSGMSQRTIMVSLRTTVGPAGFANIGYFGIYSAISKTGELYISSVDQADSNHSIVMKYSGTSWTKVGKNGLGLGAFGPCAIAISGNGVPYVIYTEPYKNGSPDNYKASVARFNGVEWLPVGNTAFSDGMINYPDIAISTEGIPYVAFKDDAHGAKLSVMHLIGARWDYVGSPGISDGSIDQISLATGNSGAVFVVFVDQANQTQNTVMRYSGSWTKLGGVPPYGGVASIATNKDGVPYIAYRSDPGGKAMVSKWNGSSLETVGNTGFSDAEIGQISIKFSSGNVPYVAFDDHYSAIPGASVSKPTVMRLDGSKWTTVGVPRMSEGISLSSTLTMDPNDVPHVTFNDEFLGRKATVIKASFDP